ncbi:putative Transposable element Tc1 transposase-like 18 [Homarus americanus]|uniref:Putative Transposable element Tc1 transposase-like 18 n=1 Tax=Homarus americanus TaxID=6706 RepID=A0A8J5TKC0_HOMAM|nr:putative Transposable element Tc1 transposase-like 18 [Homarus americanus]
MAQQRLTTRGQIIALLEEGLTMRAIADRLAVSTSTVKREEDAAIIVAIQNNPFSNAGAIREALHLDVCAQTVRSRLLEAGIQRRVSAIKERLTDQHRTGRLQFAQQYVGEDLEFWSRVVFTDEKTFASTNHGKIHMWRPIARDTTGPKYSSWLEVGM